MRFFGREGIRNECYYTPDHTKNLVLFKFNSIHNKDKVTKVQGLEYDLNRLDFKPFSEGPPQNNDYKTVFINNLHPNHFLQLTPVDDPDLEDSETLEDKKNDLANVIKQKVPGIENTPLY